MMFIWFLLILVCPAADVWAGQIKITTYIGEPSAYYSEVYENVDVGTLSADNVHVEYGISDYDESLTGLNLKNKYRVLIKRPDLATSVWNSEDTALVSLLGQMHLTPTAINSKVTLEGKTSESGNPTRQWWFGFDAELGGRNESYTYMTQYGTQTGTAFVKGSFGIAGPSASLNIGYNGGLNIQGATGGFVSAPGDLRTHGLKLESSDGSAKFAIGVDPSDNNNFKINRGTFPGENNDFVIQRSNGNVGIGVTSPHKKLEVGGDMSLNYGFYMDDYRSGSGAQIKGNMFSGGVTEVSGTWYHDPVIVQSEVHKVTDNRGCQAFGVDANPGAIRYVADHWENCEQNPDWFFNWQWYPVTQKISFDPTTPTCSISGGTTNCTATCPGTKRAYSGGYISSPNPYSNDPSLDDGGYIVESRPTAAGDGWFCRATYRWTRPNTSSNWTRSNPQNTCYAVCVQ